MVEKHSRAEDTSSTSRSSTDNASENPVRYTDGTESLRTQYFQCLAAAQGSCAVPERRTDATNGAGGPGGESLVMTNPFERVTPPRPITADTVLPRSNWTVAVNLTTTEDHQRFPEGDSNDRVYAGARSKTAQLLEMAESTRDKPVTLVVQNAEPYPGQPNRQQLHTYIINNGEILELPARPSAGMAADTQALLATAGRQAPSDHIALISQSHGGGPHGTSGGTGEASLQQMSAAIKAGLAGSGHDRLDLLDFDACSMGNTVAIAAMADSADHIVASPETESTSGPNVDGQNVRAIVQSLLAQPNMDGGQLGRRVVGLAAEGANGGERATNPLDSEPGTSSLSHYDSSKVAQFTASVDSMGAALTAAWGQGNNREAIRAAIENSAASTRIEGVRLGGTPRPEQRDVKGLADNLLSGIASGAITDTNGDLKRAAQAVLDARSQMVVSYHGEQEGGYDRQGGISLFMPGKLFFNNLARADEISPVGELAYFGSRSKGGGFEDRQFLAGSISGEIGGAREQLSPELAQHLQPLEQAGAAIGRATNEAEFNAALRDYSLAVRTFEHSPAGVELTRKALETAEAKMNEVFQSELQPTTPAWNQFLETVRRSSPEIYQR